ncbi:hypothetical protein Clacol_010267 [Clathrus columnatus]|uniref:VPS10 domain-containing protein n=1 Tax=Clathrus columnatus TaxID=1419009 RepID=A0AAV5ATM6_9AGAM|nr:hypothetical protein Clacol_010267 [Clathrus columnatus]
MYHFIQVVTYFDAFTRQVWISNNEGKSWRIIDSIPPNSATLLVPHPFDNRMGFILTDKTTHYRTDDRGETWHSFDVPAPPSLISEPLTFHSTKHDHVLYQGMVCEKDGWWGSLCHDELFASTDFFESDKRIVTLPGGNKDSGGVVALAMVSKFAVVATKSFNLGSQDEMVLFVSTDAQNWGRAQFPHTTASKLRENAYTIVESTLHSLGVDVLLYPRSAVGTLFVSNSNGTQFVQSLQNTNRNREGFVDFENIYGIEGVGIANAVDNAVEVDGRGVEKVIKTFATFDDGSSWAPLLAPEKDAQNNPIGCDVSHPSSCSLHLHSVTSPHNIGRVFSSPAPGYVLGVGNVGDRLKPYRECDTFLSTDGGVSWKMVHKDSHIYEFGDKGSLMVLASDEEVIDKVLYSSDAGLSWQVLDLGIKIKARALTTVSDSTSQKFLLLGTVDRESKGGDDQAHAAIFLDFATLPRNKCTDNDLEKWYARNGRGRKCVMGHQQWYHRKKPEADCYMGDKFTDPVEHEERCECEDEDYECDFNYVLEDNKCIPQGPEPIPAGVCEDASGTYMGSSGYRLIPGNTCLGGVRKDDKVKKDCAKAQLPAGEISHQTFEFPSRVHQHEYFRESRTILVRLDDGSIYQSSNDGYTWTHIRPNDRFLGFYMHAHSNDRAYLITTSFEIYHTIDAGKTWNSMKVPLAASIFGAPIMSFHPQESDWIIWMGGTGDCNNFASDCHAEAFYTTNNGGKWDKIETYVKSCGWARDTDLKIDRQLILCESYRNKKGNQRYFGAANPLELWEGSDFYKNKVKLFDNIVGFTKFSEYLIVAEFHPQEVSLDLQVSLDGKHFAIGMFPSDLRINNHAYTVLESSTDSIFLHLTVSERPFAEYGSILKSNSNGTFFGVSVEQVNRNKEGFVDFEKMIGLDGIALINIVANPHDAEISGHKKLQTRITHNDGGSWKPLTPPNRDSNKQSYACSSTYLKKCALHLHGYTARRDPRATYSTPSVPGLIMGVGNVGEFLELYGDSDTFLSRDGGFIWEEIHKGAYLWEYLDSGSLLVMADDEHPTNVVLFSTDQGLSWHEYNFGESMRVESIVTVPEDTSRRIILLGSYPRSPRVTVAVHVDFSSLLRRQCVLDVKNSVDDDFELWSPSEQREEQCLFGRKTLFHRRIRDRECYVGDQQKDVEKLVQNCTCIDSDFECEFNHVRNEDGECVLIPGMTPLPSDDSVCRNDDVDFWYDRTAYRKIPHSSCTGGKRPDRGAEHICPGPRHHSACTIRLPEQRPSFSSGSFADSGLVATVLSIPFFLFGLAGIGWERVMSQSSDLRARYGYRTVPVDEDAQVLRFEDDE